jgi:ribosomal protein S18 acetylase RimI-like enzyme
LYASTRAAELALVGWTAREKADFIDMQFDAQSRQYAAAYDAASFVVIEVDGEPAGRLSRAAMPSEMRIIDIALLPAHRGRGIGTALIEAILDEARASRCVVTIHVELGNRAQRLYERLGFAVVEQRGLHTFMEWKG